MSAASDFLGADAYMHVGLDALIWTVKFEMADTMVGSNWILNEQLDGMNLNRTVEVDDPYP